MKKNLLLATVSLVAFGLAAPAVAADLRQPYTKAPPAVVAVYDWSGFYIGINGGWGRTGFGDVDFLGGSLDATGGTVGGQIGYRWQTSNWVFGVEAQGNWADFNDTVTTADIPTIRNITGVAQINLVTALSLKARTEAFGLFTGQLGYAWNNILLYVKGGAAVVSNKYDFNAVINGTNTPFASGNETRWGGTVGVGLEIGFAPNWTVGLEYNHIFLSDNDVTVNVAPAFAIVNQGSFNVRNTSQDVDMGLVRLNYRF